MKAVLTLLVIVIFPAFCQQIFSANNKTDKIDVVIENTEMRLVIGANGRAKSLVHKASGEECLIKNANIPICAITEYRPYDNELFLTYPAKKRTFGASNVWREGKELKIEFEEIAYTATVSLNITDDYIGFRLFRLDYEIEKIGVKRKTEIDEFTLLQLPVKHRKYFGEWLNVVWDEQVAVNLLATDHYARIDAFSNKDYNLLFAGMDNSVKLMDVGVALIVTNKDRLLDRIDRVEKDYKLPLGVESRRSEAYKYSYYELRDVTTQNIDRHIEYARRGGFKMIVLYYPDFSHAMGHFPWRDSYPNGIQDLKIITEKIRKAGMIPGFHIHYNKAAKNDLYVSPVPDSRLNLVRMFTLSDSIDTKSTTIYVEENPEGCTLEDERRFLKIGNELITYTGYTTTFPYSFTGCKRGELGTAVKGIEKGFKFGLLDVDTWPLFIRFDQNTSIQQEVAQRIGEIYADAGFEFVYFDGAEDVHPPYWYNVSKSQLIVYNELKPGPLLSEGALKSHFGWHILTRGNAFDLFRPEDIREATKKYTIKAAEYIAQDFTSINFGWNDYIAPDSETIGMQPDMYEYICSRGAAWDCPIALMGKLDQLDRHPRTEDNLEVIKKWEEIRINNLLTKQQKKQLKDTSQEHILLKNKNGRYDLFPYKQIKIANENLKNIRAFIFKKDGNPWIVYWHIRGEGKIQLPVESRKIRLFENADNEMIFEGSGESVMLPVGKRRYIELKVSESKAMKIFEKAELIY